MRIEILGCRGRIEVSAPGYVNHSGVLIDDTLLLDLGELSFLQRAPRWIFLTHLHEDHAAFLDQPMEYSDIPIYAPQPSRVQDLRIARGTIDIDKYQITAVPTDHSARVRSQGYLVEADLQRVLYTGDMISVKPRYRDRLPDVDLVITEGSFLRHGGIIRFDDKGRAHGHNGIPELVDYFSGITDRILITHFGSWFFHDIPASIQAIEALSGKASVKAAHDGLVVEL